jgi:hypothetical protein
MLSCARKAAGPEGLGTAPTSEVIDDDATTLLV